MSSEQIVLWISEQEGDVPEIFAIPLDMFGKTLPPLNDFIEAVTKPPRNEDGEEDESEDEDSDATDGPAEDEDEQKSDRKVAPKRRKVDPVKRAFRNHIDASDYMSNLLQKLGVPTCTKVWQRVWSNPVKVVISVSFDV